MVFQDTIAAIATAPGIGAVSIVRVTGNRALEITSRIFRGKSEPSSWLSHTIHYGVLHDPSTGESIDNVLVSYMRAPHSYTGLDTIEINCHGGVMNAKRVMELVTIQGARLAEPGEFTKLAFIHGKMDLARVEAVADVIHARTESARRASAAQVMGLLSDTVAEMRQSCIRLCGLLELDLDFGEENLLQVKSDQVAADIDNVLAKLTSLADTYKSGHLLREGARAVIVGKPNVGKSSLMNSLLNRYRAIVSETPGTTRDFIEEAIEVDGIPVTFIDTAGLRSTNDQIESEGIRLSLDHIRVADLVIAVFDASSKPSHDDQILEDALRNLAETSPRTKTIRVGNKADLGTDLQQNGTTLLSAKTGQGIDLLRKKISQELGVSFIWDSPMLTQERHKKSIDAAIVSLVAAKTACVNQYSYEFVAVDIRKAIDHLGEIIGQVTSEDVLNNIFSSFCIGK